MIKHMLAALSVCAASVAVAEDYSLGDLTLTHPHSFPTAPTARMGAGYLQIMNAGDVDDRLVSAQAEFAMVQIHQSFVDANGVARMEEQKDGFVLPAGEMFELAPGGAHIMFMGLEGTPFEIGDELPVTLEFEQAGTIEIMFTVEERGAGQMAGTGHGHMDHSHMDHSHSESTSSDSN